MVDGSIQTNDLISHWLAREGFEVYTAESGVNALAKIQFLKPDIVITNVDLPDISGLRVLRSGLHLGDVRTKRFEPSHAFAMTLRHDEVKSCVNFSITDNNLCRYLKGESFESATLHNNGWSLILLDNFPLGWAKINDGRIKNKYPKGWLMS